MRSLRLGYRSLLQFRAKLREAMFLLDKSKTSLDDLKEVSQAAQEAKLDRELLRFEQELELFMSDKDLFLEELYRRLKQITSLWSSWRCQRLRNVPVTQLVSTKQIEELIHWEQNLPGRTNYARKQEILKGQRTDMLIRFLQACHESKHLYEQFFLFIYKPLHQLFGNEKAVPLSRELGRVLEQWSLLLAPGPINHRMLSPESSKAVQNMNVKSKPRDTRFNLVLRLVPDFAVKGYEALFLARQWRNTLGVSGYSRELKFMQRKKQRPSMPHESSDFSVFCNTFYNLEKRLQHSTENEAQFTGRLRNASAINRLLSTEGVLGRDYDIDAGVKFDPLTAHVPSNSSCSTPFIPESCERRIDILREDLKREQIKVQKIRTEILQGEIASRYTAEKPMISLLLQNLASAKANCWHLRNEISNQLQQGSFPGHRSFSDGLESVQSGLASLASNSIRPFTRPPLNTRRLMAHSRDQRLRYEACSTKSTHS